jgi:hypothetical protein
LVRSLQKSLEVTERHADEDKRMSAKITWHDQGEDCETTAPYGVPLVIVAVEDDTVTYARCEPSGSDW